MLWIDTLAHWLHLMSAIVWVGGMLFVGVVLTPIARRDLPPQSRGPLFAAVGKRFSAIGSGALLILFLTGLYKISQSWSSDGFWTSLAGRVIIAKITLLGVTVILNVLHDKVWGPRLAAMSPQQDPAAYKAAVTRLSVWSRVNVGVAVAIVSLGAFLRMNPF